MPQEIERKFLVRDLSFQNQAIRHASIRQVYLIRGETKETRRLRWIDGTIWYTIKGLSSSDGLIREEVEKIVTQTEAEELLKGGTIGIIEKVRYYVPYEGYLWEVDCFEGNLKGLMIAEIELREPTETPPLPPWVSEEVTGDPRYYNEQLSQVQHNSNNKHHSYK